MHRLRSLLFVSLACTLPLVGCDDEPDPGCEPGPGIICTFAGTGISGLSADHLPALETEFYLVQDMTVGPDGNLYILDWNNHRVRVLRDGLIETIIGTGSLGDGADGPALATNLNHPTHIAFSPTGQLVLSAWHNSKVMTYDAAGESVATICGTGARSYNGDGLSGVETALDLPVAVAFAPDGRMFISDQANQRIRLVTPDGNISTFAGSTRGFADGVGEAAQFNLPAPRRRDNAGEGHDLIEFLSPPSAFEQSVLTCA
ncbi:MAG: hypothetical protein HC927_13080, partial [Deltaproteobacteria bacterium]|nr:hypothetical protein [Deltaproteobacteria bacterium]